MGNIGRINFNALDFPLYTPRNVHNINKNHMMNPPDRFPEIRPNKEYPPVIMRPGIDR